MSQRHAETSSVFGFIMTYHVFLHPAWLWREMDEYEVNPDPVLFKAGVLNLFPATCLLSRKTIDLHHQ